MKKILFQIKRTNAVIILVTVIVGLCFYSNPVFGIAVPFRETSTNPVVETMNAGVTSAEIQTALDTLPDKGGEVVLPSGEFAVTQPIVLGRSHQTLRGAGDTTVLRLASNADCPVIIIGEPLNNPKHLLKDLCISGILIDGMRRVQSRELWKLTGEGSEIRNNGITIQGVSDTTVENVTCIDCRSGGLVTTRDVRRLTVRHFTSSGNEFDGLACYQTEHSLFTDLYLHDNPGAGISLDLAFNHNVVSNAVLVANDLGVFMRASRDNRFFNVIIHNSHNFGVFMAQTDSFAAGRVETAPETQCVNNNFTNLTATNCGGAAFRVNNITCTNNVIVGPKFAENLKGGLSLPEPDLVIVRQF
jgi:Right handed beta helix region